MYDLNSKFDIQKHKETYLYYFEALIFPDGHVEYAVPSHQELLIRKVCEKYNISREEMIEHIPFSAFKQLLDSLDVILCWYDCIRLPRSITKEQLNTLNELIDNEIMVLRSAEDEKK